jgi:hypothetical protein
MAVFFAPVEPLVRGQASKMDSGSIVITTQSVYVSTGLTAVFDSSVANGMALGTTHAFGIKNTSGRSRLMRFYGSIDADTGNNQTLGIKLALNGVPIDATECRAFKSTSAVEAKLVTSWMIEMADNDEVSLFVANHSTTDDITLKRARILASEVR